MTITDAETRADVNTTPRDSRYWLLELNAAHERERDWRETRGLGVIRRYRDERERTSAGNSARRVNILWANTEVLKSAVYANSPIPDVRRRFGNADPAGRNAAIILERALSYSADAAGLDEVMEQVIEDALLPGRGVAWVAYEPTIEIADDGSEQVSEQVVRAEWVYWGDYREGHARSWADMPWVARRHLWTREQLEEANLDVDTAEIQLTYSTAPVSDTKDDSEVLKRAEVWEIWDKPGKQRLYVAEGHRKVLKVQPDPYGLKGFFPVPEPLRAIASTYNRTPIPHFCLYQDQADELDRLTDRIYNITRFIKWAGAYDSANGDNVALEKLASSLDGDFIPVKNWAQLTEKGGLAGIFQEIDLEKLSIVVERLNTQRGLLIQTIYEITGISDIIRGSTNPNETLGAQKLKSQFGSMRMQKLQRNAARFVRDVMRIQAELIAEHFEQPQLAAMTQVDLPTRADLMMQAAQDAMQAMMQGAQGMGGQMGAPANGGGQQQQQPVEQEGVGAEQDAEQVTWEDVLEILHSDELRGYRVDIETDSTAFQDAEGEKAARIEFLTAFGNIMEQAIQVIQVNPAFVPLMRELVGFTLRAFKVGRTVEEAVEDTFKQLAQAAQQPPPSPEEMKAQLEAQKMQGQMQMDQQKAQIDMQGKQAELQMKMAEMNAELQMKVAELAAKLEGVQLANQLKVQAGQQALELGEAKAQQAARHAEIKAAAANKEERVNG